jgi:hypothetical protein
VRRRVVSLASAVSLALCAVVVAMWARSSRQDDVIYYFGRGMMIQAQQAHGMVLLGWGEPYPSYRYDKRAWQRFTRPALPAGAYRQSWRVSRGFSFHREEIGGSFNQIKQWRLVVPHWFIVAVLAIPPVRWAWRRRRRPRPGGCRSCGYDLRATPDRCPECGTAPIGPIAP